jgi:phosphate:Na+ symporter
MVQSSSAAMSITLIMVAQGWVPMEVGASMVLGENIGTTITAYLASLIGNVNSKRAAFIHLIFNLIGVFWMVIILMPFLHLIDNLNMYFFNYGSVFVASEVKGEAMPKALSLFHSIFNLLNAILLIGFVPQLEKLVVMLIPEKESNTNLKVLKRNMIVETPELAVMEAKSELYKMGKIVQSMIFTLREMFNANAQALEAMMDQLSKSEEKTDKMEVGISDFLMELAQQGATGETSVQIIKMVEASDELESVGDVCFQAAVILEKKVDSDIVFGNKMDKGINNMLDVLEVSANLMVKNLDAEFDEIDFEGAKRLEDQLNNIKKTLKAQNMKRMETKEEKLESSLVYRDLYNALEKIGDKVFSVTKAMHQVT